MRMRINAFLHVLQNTANYNKYPQIPPNYTLNCNDMDSCAQVIIVGKILFVCNYLK